MGRRRSPVLVGRSGDLDQLQDFVSEAFAGRAAMLLVAARAGVGKSRLVEEFAARVRASGARVVEGGCLEFGSIGLPYLPFWEALRDLAEQDGTSDEAGTAEVRAADQLHYFEQVLQTLLAASRSAPLLVVLEDLHWADASTGDLLMFLARNVRRASIALIGTLRAESTASQPALRRLVSELRRHGVGRLDLPELTGSEVKALSELLAGKPLPIATVGSLTRRSGGNAFFVEELLAADMIAGEQLPDSLRDLLLTSVDPLPEKVRDVLQLLAVSGQHTSFALLERVADEIGLTADGELDRALDSAVLAGLVVTDSRGIRFRHDLLREAVSGHMPPGRRRRLHRAVARVLEAEPRIAGRGLAVVASRIAYHWDEAGEAARCLVASLTAAKAASAANAPAEAVTHYRRALMLWPLVDEPVALTGVDHATVLQSAATSLQHVRKYDDAARLCEQAIPELDLAGDPTTRALARQQLAELLWLAEDEDRSHALYRDAAALVDEQPASPGKASVIAGHARSLMLADRYEEAIPRSREAIALATAAADRTTESAATVTLGASLIAGQGRLEEGVQLLLDGLTIAREIDDVDLLERAAFNLSWPLVQLGRTESAVELHHKVISVATERGRIDTVAFLRIELARVLTAAGRLEEAEALLANTESPEEGPDLILYRIARSTLYLARGDLSSALVETDVALSGSSTSSSPHARWALVHAALVAAFDGTFSLARERIDAARREIAERESADIRAEAAAVAVVIESLAARDDPRARVPAIRTRSLISEMRTLFDLVHRSGRLTPGHIATRSLAEAEAASALRQPAPELWAEAAQARDRCGSVLVGGYARLRQAESILAVGASRKEAARLVTQVLDLAERCGATWLTRLGDQLATRARLDLAGARVKAETAHPATRYGLTPRECEVLTHLVIGHTNREIGVDLFISEKTAGVHVSNLMRKLGVTNRIAAAEIGQRLGLVPS